jgi:hypothetical protein
MQRNVLDPIAAAACVKILLSFWTVCEALFLHGKVYKQESTVLHRDGHRVTCLVVLCERLGLNTTWSCSHYRCHTLFVSCDSFLTCFLLGSVLTLVVFLSYPSYLSAPTRCFLWYLLWLSHT